MKQDRRNIADQSNIRSNSLQRLEAMPKHQQQRRELFSVSPSKIFFFKDLKVNRQKADVKPDSLRAWAQKQQFGLYSCPFLLTKSRECTHIITGNRAHKNEHGNRENWKPWLKGLGLSRCIFHLQAGLSNASRWKNTQFLLWAAPPSPLGFLELPNLDKLLCSLSLLSFGISGTYRMVGYGYPVIFCINTLPNLSGIHGMIQRWILRCFRDLFGHGSRQGRATAAPSVPTRPGFLPQKTLVRRGCARPIEFQQRCCFLLW